MEVRSAGEIVEKGLSVRPDLSRDEYYRTKWVSVSSLLSVIDRARDDGNLVGERGFSASLFLSRLIRELEEETNGER